MVAVSDYSTTEIAPETGLVSVVLPVYNGSHYLRQAVDSVLAQTYRNVEIVAVDDGSTDDSTEILEDYGPPVHVHRQPNCGNVGLVRNTAIEHARGELIAFLDQDDWWLPEKLERQVAILQSEPEVGLVHHEMHHYDDVKKEYVGRFNNADSSRLTSECYEQLLLGNGIFNASVVLRCTLLSDVGRFDADVCGNTVQDYELWLRCARATKFAYIEDKLGVYRLHPNQGMWNVRESHAQLVSMLERTVGPPEAHASQAFRARFGKLLEELGIEHLDASHASGAQDCFRRSFRMSPSARTAGLFAVSLLPRAVTQRLRLARSRLRSLFKHKDASNVPVWTGRVNNRAA